MAIRSLVREDNRTPRFSLTRGRVLAGAYVIFGVLVFLAVLAARFPYGDTISSMIAPFNLKITYQAQRMSPPLGAELENVRLLSTADPSGQPLIQSSAVRLAPTIASLILGRPGLRLYAALYGGTLNAVIRRRADLVGLDFVLDRLDLAQSGPLRQLGATLDGIISGKGSAEFRGPQISDDNATLALDGNSVAVAIMNGFPPVRLGVLKGALTLENGIVTLKDVEAHGGDVEVTANGEIQVAPDLTDSTVDMRVLLRPTADGRARFGMLLKMLPHGPNGGPFTLSGPLMSPSIS